MRVDIKKRKILIVINPKSGKEQSETIVRALKIKLGEEKGNWQNYYTTGHNDLQEIDKIVNHFNPETIIAAGGDGTVNMLLPLLKDTGIKLGIIPLGSANGLAKNLNMPTDPEQALEHILTGEAQKTDLLEINREHYCIHLSDIGINARIVKRFKEENAQGFIGYGKQLIKELFSKRSAFKFKLYFGDKVKKMKAEMLILANAKAFGTGAIINPGGNLHDGKFEVVIIKPYPWWAVFTLLFSSFTGHLDKMKYVKTFQLEKAGIELKKPQELQIDGEIVDNIKSFEVKIIKHAVQLIIPVR